MPLRRETERLGVRGERETSPCITFSTLEFYSMGVSYLFLNVLAFHCPDTLVMVSPYWLLVTPLPSIPFTICKDPGQGSPPFETKNHIFPLLGPHAASFLGGDPVDLAVSFTSFLRGEAPCRHQEQLVGRGSSCLRPPSPDSLTHFSFPLWPSPGCKGPTPRVWKGAAMQPQGATLSPPGQCQQTHHSRYPLGLHRL